MSQDIYMESQRIGYAILWGIELAIVYDALSILRCVFCHKNIFIYLEDFIYWMFSAVFVFEHLFKIGNGHMRWYMALGVGIGMLTYKLTLSKQVVKCISFILKRLIFGIKKVWLFLTKPLRFFLSKSLKMLAYIRMRIRSFLRILKKKLTLAIKMLKIALCKR